MIPESTVATVSKISPTCRWTTKLSSSVERSIQVSRICDSDRVVVSRFVGASGGPAGSPGVSTEAVLL